MASNIDASFTERHSVSNQLRADKSANDSSRATSRCPISWSAVFVGLRHQRMGYGEDELLSVADGWVSRFEIICSLLRQVRLESGGTGTGTEPVHAEFARSPVRELGSRCQGLGTSRHERAQVNARLQRKRNRTVAGRTVQFGADAAKELRASFLLWSARRSRGGPYGIAGAYRQRLRLRSGEGQVPTILRKGLGLLSPVFEWPGAT